MIAAATEAAIVATGVSPDGRQVLVTRGGDIDVVSLEGTPPRNRSSPRRSMSKNAAVAGRPMDGAQFDAVGTGREVYVRPFRRRFRPVAGIHGGRHASLFSRTVDTSCFFESREALMRVAVGPKYMDRRGPGNCLTGRVNSSTLGAFCVPHL